MYHWLNRHLKLKQLEPIVERPYRRLNQRQLSVWDQQHPRPAGDPSAERKVIQWLVADSRRQMDALAPRDHGSLTRFRRIIGGGWEVLLRGLPPDPGVHLESIITRDQEACQRKLGRLRYRTIQDHQADLPVVLLSPKKHARPAARQRTVIWVDGRGKSSVGGHEDWLPPPIQRLVEHGVHVMGIDLLGQGASVADRQPRTRQPCLPGEEAFAGWTYCYNLPLMAHRVHDILAAVVLARQAGSPGQEVDLVGIGGAGPSVAAAVARAQGLVTRAAIDTQGFRFADLKDVYGVHFVPGAAKYHDLPGLMALAAPTPLWVAGEGSQIPRLVRDAYSAAGKADHATVFAGEGDDVAMAAVAWLLGHGI
jgi:hypothetical protein